MFDEINSLITDRLSDGMKLLHSLIQQLFFYRSVIESRKCVIQIDECNFSNESN